MVSPHLFYTPGCLVRFDAFLKLIEELGEYIHKRAGRLLEPPPCRPNLIVYSRGGTKKILLVPGGMHADAGSISPG